MNNREQLEQAYISTVAIALCCGVFFWVGLGWSAIGNWAHLPLLALLAGIGTVTASILEDTNRES